MPRTLITGGAGFLGSHLCDRFLDEGHEIICMDNLLTGSADNIAHLFGRKGFTFIEHDVTRYIWVPGPLDNVLHFASPASPRDYLEYPVHTLKVGSLGTHNALGLAKAKGARFLLASTSEVYGDPLQHPQREDYWGNVNPIGVRGVYDEAKRFAEAMVMAYHRSHGMQTRIVRIFNSILADQPVVAFNDEVLHLEPMEEYAERVHLAERPRRVLVPAFDPETLEVRLFEASALIKHPLQRDAFELRLRYGRSLRVTGDHSVFTRGPDGRPVAKPVREIAAGEHVAIPARLPVVERDRAEIDLAAELAKAFPGEAAELGPYGGSKRFLPNRIPVSADLLWLLGFYLAGGRAYGKDGTYLITFSSDGPNIERAKRIIEAELHTHAAFVSYTSGRAPALFAHSKVLYQLFVNVLGFATRRIPAWVMQLPLSRVKHFLEGYRCGDGTRSGKPVGELAFDTDDVDLATDLAYLLLRFGIVASLEQCEEHGERRSPFYRLTVSKLDDHDILDWDRGVTQTLDAQRIGDLVWSRVESIEPCVLTGNVFDFSVPGAENFVAGTGVCAHNTYGPRMRLRDGRALPEFMCQALEGRPITVYGDGSQTRSFIYVSDQVEGIFRLLTSEETEPVNIGNPEEISILDFAREIRDLTGSQSEIVFRPLPKDDPHVRRPDISKARRVLGWEPKVARREGLARTLEYFKEKLRQNGR